MDSTFSQNLNLLIFLLVTALSHLSAQTVVIKHHPELGDSPVYEIIIEDSGKKWIATADSIIVHEANSSIRRLPTSTGGFAMTMDKYGTVWTALRNHLVFNAKTNKKFPFLANNTNQSSTMLLRGDKLYMGTASGVRVFYYEEQERGFLLEELKNYFRGHVTTRNVNDMAFDQFGDLWVAADNGLFKIEGTESEIVQSYPATALAYHDGSLYCASYQKLLVYENLRKWKKIDDGGLLSSYRIEDIEIDSQGNLWIASNVLAMIDLEGVCHIYSNGDGFTSKHGTALSIDSEDHVWVGTEGKGIFEVYHEERSADPEVALRYDFMGDHPHNNLVILIDVSSSMKAPHKLPQLKRAIGVLVKRMRPEDEITIVSFSGEGAVLLPTTSSIESEYILGVLDTVATGGRSNVKKGLTLAYEQAALNFKSLGYNQVIVATDGEFDLPSQLLDLASINKDRAIELSILDFGKSGNSSLKKLSRKGGGKYSRIEDNSSKLYLLLEEQVKH